MMELARALMSATDARGALLCNVQNAAGRVFSHPRCGSQSQAPVPGDGCGVGYVAAGGGSPILSVVHRCQPEFAADMSVAADDGRRYWEPGPSPITVDFTDERVAAIIDRGNRIVPEMVAAACARGGRPHARHRAAGHQPAQPDLPAQLARGAGAAARSAPRHLRASTATCSAPRCRSTSRTRWRTASSPPGDVLALGGFSHAGDYAAAAVIRWQGAGHELARAAAAQHLAGDGLSPVRLRVCAAGAHPARQQRVRVCARRRRDAQLPGRARASWPSTATPTSAASRCAKRSPAAGASRRTRSCSATAPRRSSRYSRSPSAAERRTPRRACCIPIRRSTSTRRWRAPTARSRCPCRSGRVRAGRGAFRRRDPRRAPGAGVLRVAQQPDRQPFRRRRALPPGRARRLGAGGRRGLRGLRRRDVDPARAHDAGSVRHAVAVQDRPRRPAPGRADRPARRHRRARQGAPALERQRRVDGARLRHPAPSRAAGTPHPRDRRAARRARREPAGDPGLIVYPSDTNFLLVRTPVDAAAVFAGLLARGVLVKNVSAPGALANCLRITVGTALDNERCVRALRAVAHGIPRHRDRLDGHKV